MVENHVEKVENYPLQTTSTLYSPQLYLHSTKSRGKKQVHSQKNSFGQRIFTFAGRVGNGGEGTPPFSPAPARQGRPANACRTPGSKAPLRLAAPTALAPPVFLPRRSMADPARADRRQREAARAKQKELRICCEALLAVFFCPFAPGRRAFTFSGRAFRGKRRCADSSGCF